MQAQIIKLLMTDTDSTDHDIYNACKRRRSQSTEVSAQKANYFLCGHSLGAVGLHEATTFQIDERVQTCAMLLGT